MARENRTEYGPVYIYKIVLGRSRTYASYVSHVSTDGPRACYEYEKFFKYSSKVFLALMFFTKIYFFVHKTLNTCDVYRSNTFEKYLGYFSVIHCLIPLAIRITLQHTRFFGPNTILFAFFIRIARAPRAMTHL